MAFRIVPDEELSVFLRPSDVATKSFLDVPDMDPHFVQPHTAVIAPKNLNREFSNIEESYVLPPPSTKETVRVYLRVKPKTDEESHYYSIATSGGADEEDTAPSIPDGEVVSIESDYQVAITAPPDSAAYKNSVNGNGKLIHRYTFTKIFPPTSEQSLLFKEMVLPRLQDFLEGRNQLIFTYGATCSGKTFTIQGDSSRPGILPRALDVLFNTVGHNMLGEDINIKPLGFGRVATLLPREAERVAHEKKAILEMGKELQRAFESSEYSGDDSENSVASIRSRVRDETKINMGSRPLLCAVWVSFAEIYNENIYDLLEKLPEVKNKGDKPRRSPLKLAEDRGGSVYIKGLKEVSVFSADEAYQLLLIGRQNLQFAATRLNHNSSRSHCIFTVKVVRVADKEQPHCARVSMLSFCDLAGSERIKKTLNTGERQKEASNINTSLLVLGRCIKAIRHNQSIRDAKKHQNVPYRESKLTRLLQPCFIGMGKASMIVNISQSPYLFDESLQVLKFSAIASKVTIDMVQEPKVPEFKKPCDDRKNAKRKTRFSILVENNKKSLFGNRGSIAWENPQFRSTICPNPSRAVDLASTKVVEEDEDYDEDACDETVIDSKYDGLIKVIDSLKGQLIEEKQRNLKLEREVRTELCDEFNKMMVEIETSWEQRLQEEKDRASELSDWRISKMEEALMQKRKRHRLNDSSEEVDEQIAAKLLEKTKDVEQAKEELEAVKSLYASVVEEKKKVGDQAANFKHELDCANETISVLQKKCDSLESELQTSNDALKAQNVEPKISELEAKLDSTTAESQKKIAEFKSLLDEAGADYLAQDSLIKKLETEVSTFKADVAKKDEAIKELEGQVDELNALFENAASRADEKELQVFELEEQVERVTAQMEMVQKDEAGKWTEKMASEQQLMTLNDEIDQLKTENKKLRQAAENKDAENAARDKEIKNLEQEIKSLIKADKHNQEKITSRDSELNMLRKQLKELTAKLAKTENSLKESVSAVANLKLAVGATKNGETAIEALKLELDRKTAEKEELAFKAEKLQSDVEALTYDANRLKEDREKLMNHYEQTLKKKTEELILERHENGKLRQVMHNATPAKKRDDAMEQELCMLREELEKKSELIKTLAAKVTTPKRKKDSDESPAIESLKSKHAAELSKVQASYDKILKDYKETNSELLKHVPSSAAKKVMNVRRTVDDSDDENVVPESRSKGEEGNDRSTVEATPLKKKSRRTRGRRNAPTQVSFEDSIESNDVDASNTMNDDEDSKLSKRPKRGSRVSRYGRPATRKTSSSSRNGNSDESLAVPLNDTSNKLSPVVEKADVPITPAARKRKLFTHTPGPDVFTPKDDEDEGPTNTPHSIVKRQLRSKRKH